MMQSTASTGPQRCRREVLPDGAPRVIRALHARAPFERALAEAVSQRRGASA